MSTIPTTQRAWYAMRSGEAVDVVKLKSDAPVPIPGPGEVLVRVHSVAMNPVGYKLLRVGWPVHKYPSLVENDFSGVVVALGSGVTEYDIGTEVLGTVTVKDYFKGHGVMAQYITIEAKNTVRKLPSLSFDECAGIAIVGQTAYMGMIHRKIAKKDEKIFINGGSTGVGTIAVQLAKNIVGAEVVSSCSGKNAKFVESLGADKVLDYTTSPIASQLASTGPFNSVFDCIGHTSLYKASPSFLQPEGIFTSIYIEPEPCSKSQSKSAPPTMMTFVGAQMGGMISRRPVKLGGVDRKFEMMYSKWNRDWMREMLVWMEEGKLKVPIDSVHQADEAGIKAAYERSMSGRAVGKIIVRMI